MRLGVLGLYRAKEIFVRTTRLVLPRWALGLTLCLGTGLLLAVPQTAWAISGYASGSTAVAAQYPDSSAALLGPAPDISDIDQVARVTRSLRLSDSPKIQAIRRNVVHRELQAVMSGERDLAQTGSIALLLAAIGVVSVGGVLRWRRADEEI